MKPAVIVLALTALSMSGESLAQSTTDTVGTDVLQFHGHVPKNLMFISIDTTRRDHFGPYSTLGLTPFFTQIAAESVVMENHIQCSDWTYDSTTCTLAGRLHTERGHVPRLSGATPVPQNTPFLSTWLGDAGYYSILVSSNSWLSQNWRNTQGFDETYPGSGNADSLMAVARNYILDAIDDGDVTDRWFLHMHLFDPHPPYDPDPQYIEGLDHLNPWPTDLTNRDRQYAEWGPYPNMPRKRQILLENHLRRLYEADIRMTDARVASGWADLEANGLLDDTLVVFWNDHGEQFWEHANQTHAWHLNSEENDGILMFWAKNIVPGSWSEPTHSIDLVATLLDLYGIPKPPEPTGIPIGRAPADRPLFTSVIARDGVLQAVVKDGYKLQYRWNDGRVNLYDRSIDPEETVDLYDPNNVDPVAQDLWDILRTQVDMMDAIVGESPSLPPELTGP